MGVVTNSKVLLATQGLNVLFPPAGSKKSYFFHPKEGVWDSLGAPELPFPTFNTNAARVSDHEFLVFSGFRSSTSRLSTESSVYDKESGVWTPTPNVPQGKSRTNR